MLTAIVFSLIPPTGMTFPLREISPVIATLLRMGMFKANESKAVTIVHPALGPSFGVAPYKTICNNIIRNIKIVTIALEHINKSDVDKMDYVLYVSDRQLM